MLATCALHILRTVLQTGGQSSCRMAFHTTFMHMMRSAQHAHYVFSGASQQPEFCGLDLTPARYCRHQYWVVCSAIAERQTLWDPWQVVPLLASHGARVVRPYLRGFGPTRFQSGDTLRSGQQAALGSDLLALLNVLGLEGAIVAGWISQPSKSFRMLSNWHQALTAAIHSYCCL